MNDFNQRFERAGRSLAARKLAGAFDLVLKRTLLNGFNRAVADEGTLWLASSDGSKLLPVFNSGPDAGDFVKNFQQSLDRGVVSMVYHSGQPFCENEVFKNSTHDQTIDQALEQVTAAMIAVPLFFANQTRGVISCVRLGEGEFEAGQLGEIQHTATVAERLIDSHLLHELLESEV